MLKKRHDAPVFNIQETTEDPNLEALRVPMMLTKKQQNFKQTRPPKLRRTSQ